MSLIALILWLQMQLGFDGGGGIVHRVPVSRTNMLEGVFQQRKGEKRQPGPHAYGGFLLRYKYDTRRFIESGAHLLFYQIGIEQRRESFWMVAVPIRWGTQIDTSSRWSLWGGIRGVVLLSAKSLPDSARVYRFRDYFNRSQLQLQVGLERAFAEKWTLGVQISWDLAPAWDRVLFQDSRTLAHHLMLAPCIRYFAWRL